MQYVIDDLFDVLVGGGSREADPEYVRLRNRDINAWVDIRTDDIEAFIKEYAAEQPSTGSYLITVGKTTGEVYSGKHMLSDDETAEVMTAIALSVDENGWVNDVTNSTVSCKVMIRDLITVTVYNYSAGWYSQ